MTDTKKRSHRACMVENYTDNEGKPKSKWTDIGSVWPHQDGKGFDVNLKALPLDGRVVLRLDEPKPSASPAA